MGTPEGVAAAFARDVQTELTRRDITRQHLAQQVGVANSTITRWLQGSVEPAPGHVLAVERALVLEPGALTRSFGYLPVASLDRLLPLRNDLVEAVGSSDEVDDDARRLVFAILRHQLEHAQSRPRTFQASLTALLVAREMRQDRLANAIGVDPSAVSRWMRGQDPAPDQLFAAERALHLLPGSLCRHHGYVPRELVDVVLPGRSMLLSAVELSDQLTEPGREVVAMVVRDSLAS